MNDLGYHGLYWHGQSLFVRQAFVIFCWLAGYVPFIVKNARIKPSSWMGMLAPKLLLDVPATSEIWIFHDISPPFAYNTLTWHMLARSMVYHHFAS